MANLDLTQLEANLKALLAKVPAQFVALVQMLEAIIAQVSGLNIPPAPASTDGQQADLTKTDGTGTGYSLQKLKLSADELRTIREGVGDALVCDKAIEYAKGLMAGLIMAGGAV